MPEHIAFGADCAAIILLFVGLLFTVRRKIGVGTFVGALGLALMCANTVLRAYPFPTPSELKASIARLGTTINGLEKQRDELRQQIITLSGKHAETKRQFDALHRRLGAFIGGGLDMIHYHIRRLETPLLKNTAGTYYAIRFRHPRSDFFTFPERLDALANGDEDRLLSAIAAFRDQMLPLLTVRNPATLYVRGGADVPDFEEVGTAHPPFEVILKQDDDKSGEIYDPTQTLRQVYTGITRNKLLPNRRARYLGAAIHRLIPTVGPPRVLHAEPSSRSSALDRTVELIIHIQ